MSEESRDVVLALRGKKEERAKEYNMSVKASQMANYGNWVSTRKQDMFFLKRMYGEPEELVRTLETWGIRKAEFRSTRDCSFISTALRLPFMVGTLGMLCGEK